MLHAAVDSLPWLISDNRPRVRRTFARVSSTHPKPAQISEPTTVEGVLGGFVVLAFSVAVVAITALIARDLMTQFASFDFLDLVRGMSAI